MWNLGPDSKWEKRQNFMMIKVLIYNENIMIIHIKTQKNKNNKIHEENLLRNASIKKKVYLPI